jgi:adenine-specific DNA-methyltransferase
MKSKKRSGKKDIEQYEHKDKERINNPPVGLVNPETDKDAGKRIYKYDAHIDPSLQFDSQRSRVENIIDDGLEAINLEKTKEVLSELKKLQEPYLNWAGKAERTSFEVPTVSLHVHERIDPRTIIDVVRKRNGQPPDQLSLFQQPEENPPLREAVEFYKHKHNWSNRLLAGDSLLVMNSLIEKEGLAGQVQMIYIDPPYGIKYGSNFQPFINKRDVKDGKDEDLTAEPEMIKAFRDTWELGIHSYLTYLRDRLLLARELLKESGSVFVQISDENVHHVRELMEEIYGKNNYITMIASKRPTMAKNIIRNSFIYLIWYAKNKNEIKSHKLFQERKQNELPGFDKKSLGMEHKKTGESKEVTKEIRSNLEQYEDEWRFYQLDNLVAMGESGDRDFTYTYKGKTYSPGKNNWKVSLTGMKSLERSNRLEARGNTLCYKNYLDDYPVVEITNLWEDTAGPNKDVIYVVQTKDTLIQRCMLFTTDPGDLVFDPTCGSGTTAYVAEQWGRRWITCDTSRVAVTLAKQRLMTAYFDYYELSHPEEGVGSGFKYQTVPHITLKSIANNEPPDEETLYDQPLVDKSKARVTGPFTVEAVPSPVVRPLSQIEDTAVTDESVVRSGETFRQQQWRDEILKTGIRGKGGQYIRFSRVEALPATRWLHAEAETEPNNETNEDKLEPQRVVISFGPEHAPLEQKQVELAIQEAGRLVPKPKIVVFAAFQFDPEAAKDIDETNWPGVTLLKAQMNADLLTEDLKKKRASNDSFWLIGQPDVRLEMIEEGDDKGKYIVEVMGFDYYNTKTGIVESGGKEKIAMWMLDTDYDDRSLFPKQVFFPMAGENEGWHKLAKNLKAEIDEDLIEAYRGTKSLPFGVGPNKQIAVKIIDDRGIESLKILKLE